MIRYMKPNKAPRKGSRKGPATSKYGNHKATWNGMTFDSTGERDRYVELTLLQRAGKISDLQRQVPYELLPTQRGEDGKVILHGASYIADFQYEQDGKVIVEDYKGYRTDVYMLKKKLMYAVYGILIRETGEMRNG